MLANTATAAALLSVCLLGLTSCGQDEATTVRLRAGVTDGAESATVIYRVDADESTVSVGSDEDLDVEVELSGGFELEIIASNDSDGGGVRCGFSDLVPGGSAARGSATATCRASGSVSGGSADVSFDNTSTDRTEPTGGSVEAVGTPVREEVGDLLSIGIPATFSRSAPTSDDLLAEFTASSGRIVVATDPAGGDFDTFAFFAGDELVLVGTDIQPESDRRALLTQLVTSLELS